MPEDAERDAGRRRWTRAVPNYCYYFIIPPRYVLNINDIPQRFLHTIHFIYENSITVTRFRKTVIIKLKSCNYSITYTYNYTIFYLRGAKAKLFRK